MHKIGELFRLVGGGTPSTKNVDYWGEGVPWISSSDIDKKGNISITKYVTPFGIDNSSTNVVPCGTVVVVTRVGMGKVCILPHDMCFSQDMQALIPINDIKDYFAPFYKYQLMYLMSREKYNGQGTTISGITKKHLSNLEIYNPNREDQHRIVTRIEELFSQLDSGVETLKKTKEQLKVYRQAVLKEAFDNNWKCVPIGELCDCIVPNRDKPKSFSGKIKWITTPDLSENNIYINYQSAELGLTEEEIAIYKAKIIPIGSVIMTCVGKFGISAIVKEPIVINQQLHAFLPCKEIDSRFLAYYIKYRKQFFEKKATATTIKYLNKTNCNSMPFPILQISVQKELVKEIESRLSVCDSIEKTIDTALQEAEALRQSILKQAFEGGL